MNNLIGKRVKIKNLEWLWPDYRNQPATIKNYFEGEYYMEFPPDISFSREDFTVYRNQ